MSSARKNGPTYYNSHVRLVVDEKRRVQIPARWRPQRGGGEITLVLWPSEAGYCVRALTPSQMARLVQSIDQMPGGDSKKTAIKRLVGGRSAQVEVDKVGRICLPDEMAQSADLKDEAVLSGVLHCFEIWNPERYEKVQAANARLATEAFNLVE